MGWGEGDGFNLAQDLMGDLGWRDCFRPEPQEATELEQPVVSVLLSLWPLACQNP